MAFDPDSYLSSSFNPDEYLAQPSVQPETTQADQDLIEQQLLSISGISPDEKPVSEPTREQRYEQAYNRAIQQGYSDQYARLFAFDETSRTRGALDAAKTVLSGATTGMVGMFGGTVEGIINAVREGKYGTKEGADMVEQLAMQRMQEFTRQPQTEAGQESLEALGEVAAPLESLPPYFPGAQALATLSPAAQKTALASARNTINKSSLPSLRASEMGFKSNDLSVGAAQTPKELERAATAANMPIPFEGSSSLTKGQATRNFEQLQFEKETAKAGELGAPLRERVENQTSTLVSNLEALADQPGPVKTELRDIGLSIDDAITKRFDAEKAKVDKLYSDAREAGQMRAPVDISRMGLVLDDISKFEDLSGVGGLVKGAKAYAVKNNIVDDAGNPLPVTLDDAERFRQWVNDATDLTDARQSRIRRVLVSAIDDATENAGGDIYRSARSARAKMAREFENVGITKKLLSTKKGTDERAIAYEDAFKKIFLDSPIEEINKLRGTLLKGGDEGKQAWADLKSKGIEYIKESAQSASQRDAAGNPILSPDKLNRVILTLDQKGKLGSIYGKRNAQIIRDLGDLANDIYTAPPGSVNFSNTASALQVALDSLGTFAMTGIPAPVATTLMEGAKYVRNAKTKSRIKNSLNYLEGSDKAK